MDLNLKGRVALVTGSSRGLGKAIAFKLAEEGASVIINGRYSKTVGNTAYEIEKRFDFNIQAYQFTADATNPDGIKEFFSKKMPNIGRLDILVNNVGNIEKKASFLDLEDQDWLRQFDLSFMSMVRFSRESFEWLKKSGHGRIINISSLAATQPDFNASYAQYAHYVAPKAGIERVAKMMANDFGKHNITVNTICPSTLYGGGWDENVKRRAEKNGISEIEAAKNMLDDEKSKSPLLRIGQLEDAANYVAFLASDLAEFITGQVIYVDGGIKRT